MSLHKVLEKHIAKLLFKESTETKLQLQFEKLMERAKPTKNWHFERKCISKMTFDHQKPSRYYSVVGPIRIDYEIHAKERVPYLQVQDMITPFTHDYYFILKGWKDLNYEKDEEIKNEETDTNSEKERKIFALQFKKETHNILNVIKPPIQELLLYLELKSDQCFDKEYFTMLLDASLDYAKHQTSYTVVIEEIFVQLTFYHLIVDLPLQLDMFHHTQEQELSVKEKSPIQQNEEQQNDSMIMMANANMNEQVEKMEEELLAEKEGNLLNFSIDEDMEALIEDIGGLSIDIPQQSDSQ